MKEIHTYGREELVNKKLQNCKDPNLSSNMKCFCLYQTSSCFLFLCINML